MLFVSPNETRPHRIFSDVVRDLVPFRIISNPAVKPLPLPDWSTAADGSPNVFGGSPFYALQNGGKRLLTRGSRHDERVPVVWHDGEMCRVDLPVAQRAKFSNHTFSDVGTGEPASTGSRVEILF